MNTPPNGAQPKVFRLPPPNPNVPLLNRVVSNPIFDARPGEEKQHEVTWKIGEDHPLLTGWKIVRMFQDHVGVEIYSIPPPDKVGHFTRNSIPIASVRLSEEVMPVEVFVEELTAAEEEDADDDDPEDPELGEAPIASDGSVSS